MRVRVSMEIYGVGYLFKYARCCPQLTRLFGRLILPSCVFRAGALHVRHTIFGVGSSWTVVCCVLCDLNSLVYDSIESPPGWVYNYWMIDWSSCPAVERDPERVSGAWVFRGTREPVTALFQNLEDGVQVSDFILWFPGVTLEPVRAVLGHAARSLEAA